jgi:DNA-binding CsgD family transcriptional regulator
MATVHERLAALAALTDRERQVMALVCPWLSNKQVARILTVAGETVEVHLHWVFDKLAIHNRTMFGAEAGSEQPVSSPEISPASASEEVITPALTQPWPWIRFPC